jgi:hypothetical protein
MRASLSSPLEKLNEDVMTNIQLPTIHILKEQATQLRSDRSDKQLTHSQSLELLAHKYGFHDWNTLQAMSKRRAGIRPTALNIAKGEQVTGAYLGRSFSAEVLEIEHFETNRWKVVLHFSEPVDVVAFDSFSNFRQRVPCVLNSSGETEEKTSNGRAACSVESVETDG